MRMTEELLAASLKVNALQDSHDRHHEIPHLTNIKKKSNTAKVGERAESKFIRVPCKRGRSYGNCKVVQVRERPHVVLVGLIGALSEQVVYETARQSGTD